MKLPLSQIYFPSDSTFSSSVFSGNDVSRFSFLISLSPKENNSLVRTVH